MEANNSTIGLSVNNSYVTEDDLGFLNHIFVVVYILEWVAGCFGNMVAIWVLRKLMTTARTPTVVCMMNLSVADWIFCTFVVPIVASFLCFNYSPMSVLGFLATPICKVFLMYQAAIVFVSIYTMVVMTVDRYLAVVRPIESMSYRTSRKTSLVIMIVWLVAVFVFSPHFYAGYIDSTTGSCSVQWNDLDDLLSLPQHTALRFFAVFTLVFLYLAPLSVVVFLYYKILKSLFDREKLKYQRNNPRPTQNSQPKPKPKISNKKHFAESVVENESKELLSSSGGKKKPRAKTSSHNKAKVSEQATLARKRNEKTTKLVLIVVSVFAFCLLPFQIQFQIWAFDSKMTLYEMSPLVMNVMMRVAFMFFFLNSIVNPFVYTFQCQPFQEALRSNMPGFLRARVDHLNGRTRSTECPAKAEDPREKLNVDCPV